MDRKEERLECEISKLKRHLLKAVTFEQFFWIEKELGVSKKRPEHDKDYIQVVVAIGRESLIYYGMVWLGM